MIYAVVICILGESAGQWHHGECRQPHPEADPTFATLSECIDSLHKNYTRAGGLERDPNDPNRVNWWEGDGKGGEVIGAYFTCKGKNLTCKDSKDFTCTGPGSKADWK